MTDQQMHDRLRAAGERWRAETEPASPDSATSEIRPEITVQLPPRHTRWRWITAASAAVVAAALVIGGVFAFRGHDSGGGQSAAVSHPLAGVTWSRDGMSIVFRGNTMRVFDGCGGDTLAVTVTATVVRVGRELPGTAYACGGATHVAGSSAAAAQSSGAFAAITRGTFAYRRSGDTLTISRSGQSLILTTDGSAAPDLVGTIWRLSQINGRDESLSHVATGVDFHIDAGGEFTTSDGCGNQLAGHATWSDTTVDFGTYARTEIGCADQVLNQGAEMMSSIIGGTAHWQILQNRYLILTKPGVAGQVEFAAQPAANPGVLTGKTWYVSEITVGGTTLPGNVVYSAGLTLVMTDSTYTVTHTCFVTTGKLTISPSSLTFAFLKDDQHKCPQSVDPTAQQQADQALEGLLNGDTSWSVQDGTLTISKPDGKVMLESTPIVQPTTTSTTQLTMHPWQLSGTETNSSSGNSSSGSGSSAVSRSDLTFASDGTFTIAHRCYTIGGHYAVSGSSLSFTGVGNRGATPCPSNAESADGQKENDFVDGIFAGSATWQISDGQLTVTKASRSADFTAAAATSGSAALTSSTWVLHTITPAGGAAQTVVPHTFTFSGSSISGADAAADIMLTDSGMTIGKVSYRYSLDAHPLTSAQNQLLWQKILTGTVNYTINGSTLTITHQGAGSLVFIKS